MQPSGLDLDGFRYDRLAEKDDRGQAAAPTDAKSRIMWLKKQGQEHLARRFRPQPWDQLVKVLHDNGYPEEAIEVAIEKNWQKFRNNPGLLRFMYGKLYGFGYRPERVLVAALAFWFVCAVVFYYGAESGVMVPTDVTVMAKVRDKTCKLNWTQCRELIGGYTTFSPMVYSLDYILPIVDLDQKNRWAPQIVCAPQTLCPNVTWMNNSRVSYVGVGIAIFALLENLFGWIAGGVLAALTAGLIKKD